MCSLCSQVAGFLGKLCYTDVGGVLLMYRSNLEAPDLCDEYKRMARKRIDEIITQMVANRLGT